MVKYLVGGLQRSLDCCLPLEEIVSDGSGRAVAVRDAKQWIRDEAFSFFVEPFDSLLPVDLVLALPNQEEFGRGSGHQEVAVGGNGDLEKNFIN